MIGWHLTQDWPHTGLVALFPWFLLAGFRVLSLLWLIALAPAPCGKIFRRKEDVTLHAAKDSMTAYYLDFSHTTTGIAKLPF